MAEQWLLLFRYADSWDVLLIAMGTLGAVVNGLSFPAMLIVRGHTIDSFGAHQRDSSELKLKTSQDALFFVYVALVAFVASYLEVGCWMLAGERQAAKLRILYLKAILRQDVTYIDNEAFTPNCVSGDTLLVQEAISEKAGSFIRNSVQFVGGYLVGFTQSWKLALVILPFTPFLVLPGIFYGSAISEFEFQKQASYKQAGSIVDQTISSIRTVYSFVGESRALRAYSDSLQKTAELGLRQGLLKGLAMGSNGISFALWAFLAWYGCVLVIHGETNGGKVITTGLALLNGGRSLGFAMSTLKVFVEGRMAASKIFQTIERIPPIDVDRVDGIILDDVNGRLTLEDVSFAYPAHGCIPVLQNFSLDIPAGMTIALIGSSGSGKSTVVALLERFNDPSSGRVLLDGIDIKLLRLKWYRQQIGLVSQDVPLFATSIMENILCGKGDATLEEVYEAAKAANAHKFITDFPQGYETQVGEGGHKLSGGQKQRIVIGRALLKKPPILLLDEPTSSLDMESEKVVQATLDEASVGRTTFIVAHRLSTILNSDCIAVIESGRIVELGTHKELLSQENSVYRSLIQLQAYGPGPEVVREKRRSSLSPSSFRRSESSSPSGRTDSKSKHLSRFSRRRRPSFWNLLRLSTPEWKQGIVGLAGAVGFGFVQPFYAFLLGCMVSVYYIPNHDEMRSKITVYCTIFPVIMAVAFLVNIEQHCNFAAVGEYLTKRIREAMLASLLRFEVAWFDRDDNNSGSLCRRLSHDANMIRALVSDRTSLLVQTLSAVVVSFVMGLAMSWKFGILMIGTQPLFVFCYYVKLICLKGLMKRTIKAQNEASQVASEAVFHHRVVTALSSQEGVLGLLKSKLDIAMAQARKNCFIAGFALGLAYFVLYASWGLQFWYGGVLVKQGKINYDRVFKVFFVFLSTGRVIAEALGLSPDLAKSAASIDSVFRILHRRTVIDADRPEAVNPGDISGNLELCKVYFAYPSRRDFMVLRDFNLQVGAGQSVALVGPSGSGKSTVIALLERFYDPLSGVVKIDGVDIKTFHLQSLRRQIGLVSQEPSLFAASIEDNIAYGREECTHAEVVEAASIANAHSFISSLPDGYATHAGQRGARISGGQRQRIAIARAILKNPVVLLLDEATSALDTESEQLVQESLDRVMAGRTTLLVAHRLSTVRSCHCIAVVQNGTVVELGTHEELIAKGGAYFSLVSLAL